MLIAWMCGILASMRSDGQLDSDEGADRLGTLAEDQQDRLQVLMAVVAPGN
jgi:hypothetical protein